MPLAGSWSLRPLPPLHHHPPQSESARQVRPLLQHQLTKGARPLARPHFLVTPANCYAKDGAVLGVSTTLAPKRERFSQCFRRNALVAGRVFIPSLPLLDPVHPHPHPFPPLQCPRHLHWTSLPLIYRYRPILARPRAAQSTISRAKLMGGLGRRLLQTASFVGVSCLHPCYAGHAPSALKVVLRHNERRRPVPVLPRLRRTAPQRRLSASVITNMTTRMWTRWKQAPSVRAFSAAVRQRSISHLILCLLHARSGHQPSPRRPRHITFARSARCRAQTQTPRPRALQLRQHSYRPRLFRHCWRKARILVTRAKVPDRMTVLCL